MRGLKGAFGLAFLLGGLWGVKDYTAWMPLRGYRVEAEAPALERRLWDVFPSRGLAFWPYLLRDVEGFQQFLERDMPVSVQTRMTGFGRFETRIGWLEPWLKVEWRGRLWSLSRDGRMWDLSEMGEFLGDASFQGPVWRLLAGGDGVETAPSGVFSSPIPVEAIDAFMGEYQQCAWFGAVKEIAMDRRAGEDLFRLKLTRGGQNFEVLIQRTKYAGQDLGSAINEILSRLAGEGGDHLIDATYEGKVLLRNLSSRAQEGSRE